MNKSSPSPGILYSYISYVLNVLIRGLAVDQTCYRLCLYLEAEIRRKSHGLNPQVFIINNCGK